jgi:hypothetical protein
MRVHPPVPINNSDRVYAMMTSQRIIPRTVLELKMSLISRFHELVTFIRSLMAEHVPRSGDFPDTYGRFWKLDEHPCHATTNQHMLL